MPELLQTIGLLLIGCLASFIGSMVGGGGLINITLLILVGVPPSVAIATSKFAGVASAGSSFTKYAKDKQIVWKYVAILVILSLLGAVIGSELLIVTDAKILKAIVTILLLIPIPLILFSKKSGLNIITTSILKKIIGSLLYFGAGIYGGFFGGGSGILTISSLVFGYGLTYVKASATDVLPWLISSIISCVIFYQHGLINFQYGIILFIGSILGGYLGAKTAVLKGNRWVKIIFLFMTVALVFKLIFS
ncbi:MAG: sulfite exporter TauE/SafE family protein [Candidatus Magasanikbacteria bacterium]